MAMSHLPNSSLPNLCALVNATTVSSVFTHSWTFLDSLKKLKLISEPQLVLELGAP